MTFSTTGQPIYVQALLDWGLGYSLSWTGNAGQADTVTYSFDSTLNGRGYTSNIADYGTAEEAVARDVMSDIETFANVTFVESNFNPDIVYAERDLSAGTAGLTAISFFPSAQRLAYADVYYDDSGTNAGQSGYHTIYHEIGHAMGLGHPNDSGFNPNYDMDETVMSYNGGSVATGGVTRWPSGAMIYDIATLQFLYGANMNYNAGDTTYNLDSGEITTLWDAGGEDTFDTSNTSTNNRLDLRGGVDESGNARFSFVGDTRLALAFDPLNASGVVDIEHAIGGSGKDLIYGGAVDGRLEGGAENDAIYGGTGNNTILGGAGNDLLDGGGGINTISHAFSGSGVNVNFQTNRSDGEGADAISGFTHAIGSEQNDTIIANDDANRLDGLAGNDTITGLAGDDTLIGAAGDDTLIGGEGIDWLYGGGNNDSIDGGDDVDRLYGQAGDDTIFSGAGNDIARGNTGNDSVDGGAGIDKLFGSEGDDTVNGGADKDYVYGDAGNDILIGGAGIDFLFGGAGSDLFSYTSLTDSFYDNTDLVIDFQAGIDGFDISGLGFTGIAESGATDEGELRFSYSSTSDRTYVRSDQSDFQIALKGDYSSSLSADSFVFNVGDTFDFAGDVITGTSGNDILIAGDYDDTIDGAAGRDRLTGGTGDDVFVFSDATHSFKNDTTNASDGITDFEVGNDVIDVSAFDYSAVGPYGALSGILYLTYSAGADRTYVQDRYSDFEFYLDGDYTLTLSDDDFIF